MKKYFLPVLVILVLGGGFYLTTMTKKEADRLPEHAQSPIQSHRSYQVELLSSAENVVPRKPTKIAFQIKDDQGSIVKDFKIEHEKLLHFITVRKDLQNFQHVHPLFDQMTGQFTIDMTFPEDGHYRLFADFTAESAQIGVDGMPLGVTVYRDITVGDMGEYSPQIISADSNTQEMFDNYTVDFKFPSEIKSQTETNYTLEVSKNGQPVTNLEHYLGALGHSILLKEGALDFIHAHAGEASGAAMQHGAKSNSKNGPEITFSTFVPELGNYKIFTQFQHEGKVITTDYTIQVK